MKESEIDKIELRSEQVNEVLGQTPNWILRSGISMMVFFIILVLIGSWFFKYPDAVMAEITITANNPSNSVIAKSTGKLEKLFVSENQIVKGNEILAIIENTANYQHIGIIISLFDSFNKYFQDGLAVLPKVPDSTMVLGEVQPFYSSFLKQYDDYNNFNKLNFHNKSIISVKKELKEQERFLARLNYKIILKNDELMLEKNQFSRDSILFHDKVIPAADFEKSKKTYIQAKNSYEEMKNEAITTSIAITNLQRAILDLESQKTEETSKQKNALKESFEVLTGQIAAWEKNYVLKSPFEGKVTLTRFWNSNQNVKTGDVVFNIVPDNFSYYIGKILLPVKNSGKIAIGQKVIIRLDNYPYMEFGMLQSKVTSVSLVSDNNFYIAEVELPLKLITSYGKELPATKELKGTAEIITQEYRLLHRMIYPLKALVDKNRLQ